MDCETSCLVSLICLQYARIALNMPSIYDSEWSKRIEDLEKLVAGMSLAPLVGHGGKDNATGVVGGLQDASSAETAKSWLNEVLRKANIDGVMEIYHKGNDKFNGMLFVKFTSPSQRDVAMNKFNAMKSAFMN